MKLLQAPNQAGDQGGGGNAQQGGTGQSAFDDSQAGATGGDGRQDDAQGTASDGQAGGDANTGQAAGAAAPAQQTLTPEAIAEAIKKAGLGAGAPQQQQQQPPRQYTQEEFDRLFKVMKIGKQHVTALRNALKEGGSDDEAMQVLQEIITGAVQQSVTMTGHALSVLQEDFQGRLSPMQEFMQSQQLEALRVDFYGQYADLKPYEVLVDAVVEQMKKEGVPLTEKKSAFKLIADRAREVLKGLPNGNVVNTDTTNNQMPTSRMPRLSSGGQGGVGGGNTAAKKDPQDIFS